MRQLAVLNKLFNVRHDEWSRIVLAWFVRFFYKVSFVVGWTLTLGLFVSEYGIYSLPYLFALIALFTIIGSFVFSLFIHRFSKEELIISTVFLTGILLFIAAQFFYNSVVFFSLLIVSISVLLMQLKIFIEAYIEEMFSAIESERVFPLIEAADTVAGILAGLGIALLASVIEPHRFVYFWIVGLFMIIPLIIYNLHVSEKMKSIEAKVHKRKGVGLIAKLKHSMKNKQYSSYIKGLFMIVLLQWLLFNLLEFQYTKAVYQNASNVILEAGSGFKHSFIHDLGVLFILFSSSSLLLQLFLGSRLLNYLGIFGTMLIHPIVTIFSLFGLTASFSYGTAVLAKNNYTITSVLYANAYHGAYYAIGEESRSYMREVLEGVIRPIGAILGTVAIIALQKMLSGSELVFWLNVLMLAATCLMFYFVYIQQSRYSKVAIADLHSEHKELRMNAIDILSQRGHAGGVLHLTKILKNREKSMVMKVRVLRALAELQDITVLDDVLYSLKSYHSLIRSAALDTLFSLKLFRSWGKKNLYYKSRVIDALKLAYRVEKRGEMAEKMVRLMAKMSSVSTIDFLLKVLRSSPRANKFEAILALGKFDDEDLYEVLLPYLKSRSVELKVAAAVALAASKKSRSESLQLIETYLSSSKSREAELALFAVGELRWKDMKKKCFASLDSKNDHLKMEAALALTKMGGRRGVPVLIDLLFNANFELRQKIKSRIRNLDVRIYKNIDRIVRHMVSKELDKLMPEETSELDSLEIGDLHNLKLLYALVEEYDEVESINRLINSNNI